MHKSTTAPKLGQIQSNKTRSSNFKGCNQIFSNIMIKYNDLFNKIIYSTRCWVIHQDIVLAVSAVFRSRFFGLTSLAGQDKTTPSSAPMEMREGREIPTKKLSRVKGEAWSAFPKKGELKANDFSFRRLLPTWAPLVPIPAEKASILGFTQKR